MNFLLNNIRKGILCIGICTQFCKYSWGSKNVIYRQCPYRVSVCLPVLLLCFCLTGHLLEPVSSPLRQSAEQKTT